MKTRKKIREQKKIRIFFDKFDNKCCKGYETIFTFAEHEKFFFFSKVFLTLEKNSDENDPTLKTSDSVEPKTVLQDLRINRIF